MNKFLKRFFGKKYRIRKEINDTQYSGIQEIYIVEQKVLGFFYMKCVYSSSFTNLKAAEKRVQELTEHDRKMNAPQGVLKYYDKEGNEI